LAPFHLFRITQLIQCLLLQLLQQTLDKYHPVAIATLIELIPNYHPEYSIFDPADSLLQIMKGKHFATAVSGLKKCLTSEIYKNDFGRNERCHEVIWECAENMTYPEFYQAWHA
ncbi:hypothetical protein QUA45_24560, partial [Microcoleus sp. Pol12A5]